MLLIAILAVPASGCKLVTYLRVISLPVLAHRTGKVLLTCPVMQPVVSIVVRFDLCSLLGFSTVTKVQSTGNMLVDLKGVVSIGLHDAIGFVLVSNGRPGRHGVKRLCIVIGFMLGLLLLRGTVNAPRRPRRSMLVLKWFGRVSFNSVPRPVLLMHIRLLVLRIKVYSRSTALLHMLRADGQAITTVVSALWPVLTPVCRLLRLIELLLVAPIIIIPTLVTIVDVVPALRVEVGTR